MQLPQNAIRLDSRIKEDVTAEALMKEVCERLHIGCPSEGTVISCMLKRDLILTRTLAEEGVKNGDRLMLLYGKQDCMGQEHKREGE
ncbi:MAG TPA: hypothetical protein DCL38_10245 [Lachnospiraceae bacterium]|nr:hypothetical protein [Lachnospiraceae bacterium]